MRIFTFGETVYDIIFKNSQPIAAKAGGSMLNTSVSLGRLGLDVNFVSDLGKDIIGDTILNFLTENRVSVSCIERYPDHKTAIAIAFLDDRNDASYTFYKDFPENRLSSLKLNFEEGDIVLFGSFFAITENLRSVLRRILNHAREEGCIIIYDPNFRESHLHELEKLKPFIIENIAFSDMVRGSDEDFNLIFGANNASEAFDVIMDAGCGNMIYTANRNNIIMKSQDNTITSTVPVIEPVSTIGAGDNFNAGLIFTLVQNEVTKKDMEHLSSKIMEKILSNGTSFASEVCMSYDNYISRDFASRINNSSFGFP
jgi:fructokinase